MWLRQAGCSRPALSLALALAGLTQACEQHRPEPLTTPSASEPSPNASVLPAPLAAGPTKASARDAGHPAPDISADAAVMEPPRPIREDEALPAESELRVAPGLSLEARLRWLEPPPPRLPETSAEAIARAREKTAFELSVELSSLGRLRLSFAARAYPFPPSTELRARDDRFGHLLVWPNGATYTPLPPGTLRAALGDARVDVAPLSEPSVTLVGAGSMLGLPTQKQRLENSIGRVELEQTAAPMAGSSGLLFCRLLLELLAVSPESVACRNEWVPLRAELTWASGARFELEVTKLLKRTELPVDGLAVPPSGSEARRGELPGPPFVALVDERELGDFRVRPLQPTEKPDPAAPKLGLVFQNRSDGPRYLVVDGVPVVWLRPGAEWLLSGLKPGRYNVQARDFFGAESTPPKTLELPARFLVGEEPERVAPH
jgi:hypothetical protein